MKVNIQLKTIDTTNRYVTCLISHKSKEIILLRYSLVQSSDMYLQK